MLFPSNDFPGEQKNARKTYEIYSKLTIKIDEWRHLRRSVIFIVDFDQISELLVFTVEFELVNVC